MLENYFKRLDGETPNEYRARITARKQEIGTWQDLADLINSELGYSYSEKWYRTKAKKDCYDQIESIDDNDGYDKPVLEEFASYEAKVSLRNERNTLNRLKTAIVREKETLDIIERVLKDTGKEKYKPVKIISQHNSEKAMVVLLSDLHTGLTFDSPFGKYSTTIEKERMDKYLQSIIELQNIWKVKNCYVFLLGDLISGNIHKTIQISNKEHIVQQIKKAGEMVCDFVYELSSHFDQIQVHSVNGNHSRIDSKDDAVHDDRLDDLIIWHVNCKLGHIEKIGIHENPLDSSLDVVSIFDNAYPIIHGDCDILSQSGVAKLIEKMGVIPKAIFAGHGHTPEYKPFGNVETVQNGCMSGSGDDYTNAKRYGGFPCQVACLLDKQGICSIFPIKL